MLFQNARPSPQFLTPANDERKWRTQQSDQEKGPCLTFVDTRLHANSLESNKEETKNILPPGSIPRNSVPSKEISRRPCEFRYAQHRPVKIQNKKLCGMQTTKLRERDATMPREKRTWSTNARLPAQVPAGCVAKISRRHRKRQDRDRRSARPKRRER